MVRISVRILVLVGVLVGVLIRALVGALVRIRVTVFGIARIIRRNSLILNVNSLKCHLTPACV